MKKLFFIFLFLPLLASATDKYWVGGTGNWSDTGHWSTSSGGSSGAAVPSASDNVIFDAASHSAGYTMTVDATATCLSMTWANPASGSPTWAGSSGLTISGSLTYVSGMTASYTGTITFNATSTGKTILSAGISVESPYTFNGSGGGWTLSDALSISKTITLVSGTFDTGNQTITQGSSGAGFVGTGSATRVLTLGSSSWSLLGAWNVSGAGFTVNAGTSTVTTSLDFYPGNSSPTYYDVVMNQSGTTIPYIGASFTCHNFTRTGGGGYSSLRLEAGFTTTNNLTISGASSAMQRILVYSGAVGTSRTITCNGAVSITNVDFRDITGAGSASWAGGTSIGNAGGVSGITTTTPVTRYWVHGANSSYNFVAGGRWASSSGGSVGLSDPLPQDSVVFDANSFAASGKTVNMNLGGYRIGSMTWTGATNNPTVSMGYTEIHGSLTLIAGMSMTSAIVFGFFGRSSFNITTAGQSSFESIVISGGPYTLQDAITTTSTGTITHSYGTLNLNNFNVSTNSYVVDGSLTRALTMGSSTITLTGSGSTVWDANPSTNFTLTPNTSTIKMTNATSTQKTFAGGGLTYNNIWLTGSGTGEFRFTGSNTFNDFKCDTPPHTIKFTAGTTTTVTTWNVAGTAGNLMTIGSLTASAATIAKSGGSGQISTDYSSVSYITGSPAITWYFGTNSTNGGNNTTVYFTPPPIYAYFTSSTMTNDFIAATNSTGTDWSRVSPATTATGCTSGPISQGFSSDGTYDTAEGAFEFSVTPTTGFQLNVTDFAADLRRSGNGPTLWRFAYSIDSRGSWVDAGADVAPGGTSCTNFTNRTWNPTDFTVSAGTTLYLRLYAFSAASSSDTGSCRNIVINGTVTAVGAGMSNAQKAAFFFFMDN